MQYNSVLCACFFRSLVIIDIMFFNCLSIFSGQLFSKVHLCLVSIIFFL